LSTILNRRFDRDYPAAKPMKRLKALAARGWVPDTLAKRVFLVALVSVIVWAVVIVALMSAPD
jgi:hypothetical protein